MHSHYCKLDSVQSCLIEIWHWLLKQQWRWKHLLLFAYVLASFNMFSWSLCVCSRNEEIYNVGASPSSSRISLKWVLNFLINLCCQLYNYKVQGVTMNYIRQQHLWSRDWRFWRRRIWSILLKCCDAIADIGPLPQILNDNRKCVTNMFAFLLNDWGTSLNLLIRVITDSWFRSLLGSACDNSA